MFFFCKKRQTVNYGNVGDLFVGFFSKTKSANMYVVLYCTCVHTLRCSYRQAIRARVPQTVYSTHTRRIKVQNPDL